MADNGTAASGPTIAWDDIGSVSYQRMKLIHGIDGVNDGDVSNINPLPVSARQSQQWVGATAVPGTAAAAYAAGDQFGTLITLTNSARSSGGGGFVTSVTFSDADALITALDIFFFHDTVTLAADNAAFSISDADVEKVLWVCRMTYFEPLALNRINTQNVGISIPYFCTGTSLYAAVRIQTAYTLAATTSPKYKIAVSRD